MSSHTERLEECLQLLEAVARRHCPRKCSSGIDSLDGSHKLIPRHLERGSEERGSEERRSEERRSEERRSEERGEGRGERL